MPQPPGPDDAGLPYAAVRIRRRCRRMARIMLIISALSAGGGWVIFGKSVISAIRITDQPISSVIVAYILLILSSTTLVVGLWYLLLAQVERVARIVEADDAEDEPARRLCPNCGWFFETPDRYCRHCGKPLGTFVMAHGEKAEPS